MTSHLMTLGIALLLAGQVPEPQIGQVPEPIENLATKLIVPIRLAGYHRVAVIPRFIHQEGGRESWGGALGPHGEWLAQAFTKALEDQAKGRFEIVKSADLAKAFQTLKVTPTRLADLELLKALAQQAGGFDGLIIGRSEDIREPNTPGGKLVRSVILGNLIDLSTGELKGSAYRDLPTTPSLAAYRGESPGTGAYIPLGVGLSEPSSKGANAPNLPPPARDPGNRVGTPEAGSAPNPAGPGRVEIPALDDPRCPFPVRILVDDEVRPLLKVTDPKTGRVDFYADLEPGESYQIAVVNRTDRTAYGVIYVDGINILGVRRDPEDPRYWNMAPGQDCRFRGWYVKEKDGYKEIPLIVRPASDSIAAQVGSGKDGFAERVGVIQCLFFGTEGDSAAQGGPKNQGGAKSMMLGRIGTGGGDAREIQIGEVAGPKRSEDHLLSFVIRYAPMSQIEKIRSVKD